MRSGWATVECGPGSGMVRIGTANYRILDGGTVETVFSLPARMPGTSLRTAWLDWRFNAQAPSENPAYLHVFAGELGRADGPTRDRGRRRERRRGGSCRPAPAR